jgi:branched-chain amino acid transport system permease protein
MSTVLVAGFSSGCLIGMVAIAIVMIFRTSGVVNFAQGEFMTVAAYVFVPLAARSANSFESLLLPVLAGLVMGAVFFFVTEVFLVRADLLMQMMATFALSLLIVSILIVVKGDQTVPVTGWFKSNSLFYLFATHINGNEIIEVLSTFVIVVVLQLTFRFTSFGKNIEAVSENRRASNLSGISPRVTIAACWMIGGAITAFAGVLYGPLAGVTPQMGDALLFPAFVAATIGGFNSVTSAATGGIAVGVIVSLANHFFGGSISTVAVFVVLVVVLLVKPSGFGGKFELSRV